MRKSRIMECKLADSAQSKAILAENICHDFSRHSHGSWIIGAMLRGSRIMIIDDFKEIYSKAEVFLLRPLQQHHCISAFSGGYDYLALSLLPEVLRATRTENILTVVQNLFSEAFALLIQDKYPAALLTEVQANVARLRVDWDAQQEIADLSLPIRLGIEFIQRHYVLKITLEDIAEYAGVNKYYYQRLFVREFGMSPAAYIDKLRVASALAAINAGVSPSIAALDAGFADQSHLCRVVKKVTGVTVRNFRQE